MVVLLAAKYTLQRPTRLQIWTGPEAAGQSFCAYLSLSHVRRLCLADACWPAVPIQGVWHVIDPGPTGAVVKVTALIDRIYASAWEKVAWFPHLRSCASDASDVHLTTHEAQGSAEAD